MPWAGGGNAVCGGSAFWHAGLEGVRVRGGGLCQEGIPACHGRAARVYNPGWGWLCPGVNGQQPLGGTRLPPHLIGGRGGRTVVCACKCTTNDYASGNRHTHVKRALHTSMLHGGQKLPRQHAAGLVCSFG